jgi:hypothetical protein
MELWIKTRLWKANGIAMPKTAPEGRPNLAQRFSAGKVKDNDSSPGGTTELRES